MNSSFKTFLQNNLDSGIKGGGGANKRRGVEKNLRVVERGEGVAANSGGGGGGEEKVKC